MYCCKALKLRAKSQKQKSDTMLEYILSPPILANNVDIIGIILGGIFLVLFGSFVNKQLVFPLGEWLKDKTYRSMKEVKALKIPRTFTKYFSQLMATALFITYCWLGGAVLSEYVFIPILQKLKPFILVVVVILICAINYIINNKKLRHELMNIQKVKVYSK